MPFFGKQLFADKTASSDLTNALRGPKLLVPRQYRRSSGEGLDWPIDSKPVPTFPAFASRQHAKSRITSFFRGAGCMLTMENPEPHSFQLLQGQISRHPASSFDDTRPKHGIYPCRTSNQLESHGPRGAEVPSAFSVHPMLWHIDDANKQGWVRA